MKPKNLCNSLYCDIFTLLLWSGTDPAISLRYAYYILILLSKPTEYTTP